VPPSTYGRGLRGLSLATIATISLALVLVFFYAPLDADQGFVQKIFYLHVPLAIVALGGWVAGGIFAIQHLRTGERKWDYRSYVAIHMSLIFGLGTLIRSQIGSVVTAMVIYLVGFVGGIAVFNLIRAYLIHGDWVLTAAVSMPAIASTIMVSPEKVYPEAAPWWVGALVMAGWSLVAGAIGVLLNRRRDIS